MKKKKKRKKKQTVLNNLEKKDAGLHAINPRCLSAHLVILRHNKHAAPPTLDWIHLINRSRGVLDGGSETFQEDVTAPGHWSCGVDQRAF